MNAFMKRTTVLGAVGATSALLVTAMVAPAQAYEGSTSHSDNTSSSSSSVTKFLNDNLNGFTARDNDRNGILNGDDLIGGVLGGDNGNLTDIANGDNGNISDSGNVSDVANGDVLSNNGGNEILNGNDTLNGNEVGGVDTGDIGNVDTGDIGSGNGSGNETNIGNGDVSVLDGADVLNDTLDVVDNNLSGTVDDVFSHIDGSKWDGGDWGKW